MFKRAGWYYVAFGHTCCYCLAGSNVRLYAARDPLGPYAALGDIAPYPCAYDLGIDPRTTGFGVLEFLDDEPTGALTQNETVTIGIERSAGAFGFVVARGEGVEGCKAAKGHGCDRRLGSPGNHDICFIVPDFSACVSDCVCG